MRLLATEKIIYFLILKNEQIVEEYEASLFCPFINEAYE